MSDLHTTRVDMPRGSFPLTITIERTDTGEVLVNETITEQDAERLAGLVIPGLPGVPKKFTITDGTGATEVRYTDGNGTRVDSVVP